MKNRNNLLEEVQVRCMIEAKFTEAVEQIMNESQNCGLLTLEITYRQCKPQCVCSWSKSQGSQKPQIIKTVLKTSLVTRQFTMKS